MFVPETPRKLPDFVTWPGFPFEGDLRVRPLEPVADVEPPRDGEDIADCTACAAPDQAYIWVSERWRVRAMDRPTGLPMVLILESRSHLDLGDLPNLLAAELGVMTVRLERAIRSLDGVARVHVNRWGDGSAHLHLWFLARPTGHLQLRGSFLSLWNDILPAVSEAQWRENLALVAAWLAEFGGRPLAEPPRIEWQAPSTFAPTEAAAHAPNGTAVSPGAAATEAAGTADSAGTSEATGAAPAGEATVGSKAAPAIGRATVEAHAAHPAPADPALAHPTQAASDHPAQPASAPTPAANGSSATDGTPAVREVTAAEVATERMERPAERQTVPAPRTSPESAAGAAATADAAGTGGARAAAS